MSSPKPREEQLLSSALVALHEVAPALDSRLEVLECVASSLGGFSFGAFRDRFETTRTLSDTIAAEGAKRVLDALQTCPIHPSLALAALARLPLSESERRTSGAYYTDFRLAQLLASRATHRLVPGAQVIDPAAGTGILLVAATLAACGHDRFRRASWIAKSVTAWDRSEAALRGARLAVASLTDDLDSITAMTARWKCHDSLLVDRPSWGDFDVVIANPPWEKVKLTRHEFLLASGESRHYGEDYDGFDGKLFVSRRDDVARYGSALVSRFPLLGRGEPDLYKAFLELFVRLARPDGCVSVLLPAGLLRSQGTEDLRRLLLENSKQLTFTIMDNRARFFAIDTRFKFLGLSFDKATTEDKGGDIQVSHAQGTEGGVAEIGSARLSRKTLRRLRPDLTVPEVRSDAEWRLFRRMSEKSRTVSREGPWRSVIVREIDMTRDRKNFVRSPSRGCLPLVEGRMVHQHRFGAKAYVNGTGRRSKWDVLPVGSGELTPQFWYPENELPPPIQHRANQLRAGFCDITGQTNERSMLAALIPTGVACGNKVPTITFPNDPSEGRLLLWLAIANSLSFDWALRRVVTTTVNFFVLNSVPLPQLEPDSLPGRRLIAAARELRSVDEGKQAADLWSLARCRAAIDTTVHGAYGLGFKELILMLEDFPLLDRGQPSIDGEARSTITRDFLLVNAAAAFGHEPGEYAARLRRASELGAIPYVPSEFLAAGSDAGALEADHV